VLPGGIIDRMEQRLEDVEARYEELSREMASPDVATDPARLRELGKTFAELEEIVLPYRRYKAVRREAEEARTLAAQESEPGAARARDRVAGPHPHLDRDGRRPAGGGGRRRRDPSGRHRGRRVPFERPRRAVGEHDRLRGPDHAQADGDRRLGPGGTLTAAE